MKKFIAALLLACPTIVSAGLINGDSVTLTFAPTGGTDNGTTGAGSEFSFGAFAFDLNGGANGDIFTFTSTPTGGFLGGSNSFTISSLAFANSEVLVGFNLFSTSLLNLTFSTTATSLTFNYFDADGFTDAGTVIQGQYVTRNPAVQVPEPGTLALFGLGLIGLAAYRRRRV